MPLTQELVLLKLNHILASEKNHKKKDHPLPEYYPGYNKVVRLAKQIKPHYDFDVKPVELLRTKAPNIQKKEEDYILANYRPITPPYWGKAENSVGRIWNPDNFKVDYKDSDEKIPSELKNDNSQKYFENEYPHFGSIYNYFSSVVTKNKLRDANAFIAITPTFIPRNDDGTVDTSIAIEPIGVIYSSIQVLIHDFVCTFVELAEKSVVEDGNSKKQVGRVFKVYGEDTIWIVKQTGKRVENTFLIELIWTHNLGFIPTRKLGGIPEQEGDIHFDKSHFSFAIPNLQTAVVNNSTLQVSILTQAFPHMWMIVDKCKEVGCVDGRIKDRDTGKYSVCPSCQGKRPTAPSIVELKMPSGKFDANSPAPPTPPFGFEAPDIKILDFLQQNIMNTIVQAFEFIGINVSTTDVKGSKDMTATQRVIDREEFFSFLTTVSNELFGLLRWSLGTIGQMRYGVNYLTPEVKKPVNFSLRTFKELTEEIGIAREKGIPETAIVKLLQEYVEARFHTSEKFMKMMNIVIQLDPLVVDQDQDMLMKLNRGVISKEQAVLHVNILNFLEEGVRNQDIKLDDDIGGIQEYLNSKTKENIPEDTTALRTTNSLLNRVNEQ